MRVIRRLFLSKPSRLVEVPWLDDASGFVGDAAETDTVSLEAQFFIPGTIAGRLRRYIGVTLWRLSQMQSPLPKLLTLLATFRVPKDHRKHGQSSGVFYSSQNRQECVLE